MKPTTYTRLFIQDHGAIKLEAVRRGSTMPEIIGALVRAAQLEIPAVVPTVPKAKRNDAQMQFLGTVPIVVESEGQ